GEQTLESMDTISSLSSGVTNVINDSLGVVLIIVPYPFLLRHLQLVEIQSTWVVYVVAFLAIDFAGYWSHRLNHSVNYFWNHHIIHHSSEEFNLACALRQPISTLIGVYSIFLLPAAILGVPAEVIQLIAPVHLFLQFWYHTRHVPKLGWLEYVIITPSQHRVHHAINPEYLDKNLGQIFPWWDRMFGTFQEELDDVPPVYGVTRAVRTWNPWRINFQHLWLLIRDAWRAGSWRDKLRIWLMPTGWRPADVAERFPVAKIEDPYDFEKYRPPASPGLKAWAWFRFSSTLALLLYMLASFGEIPFRDLAVFSLFLVIGIFGYTELMDHSRLGPWVEGAVGLGGLAYLGVTGSWFGLGQVIPGGDLIMALYFLATAVGGVIFGLPRFADPSSCEGARGGEPRDSPRPA
ncbi:MAG: sterol desaturase family protein, partial [Holophagales bacterium]|nr:sterol desaturase family protein [Holophagales bacterium]